MLSAVGDGGCGSDRGCSGVGWEGSERRESIRGVVGLQQKPGMNLRERDCVEGAREVEEIL